MQFARISLAGVLAAAAMFCAAIALPAAAETNAGQIRPRADKPFVATPVATFDEPWAIAFLPDGRMLITEKPGRMFLVDARGRKTALSGVPKVAYGGQNGLLDVVPAPDYAASRAIYFTYLEPGPGGSGLALARAVLDESGGAAALRNLSVIWRQTPKGSGGQPGGIIAFAPDGKHLFLTSGDRMRPDTAQDPELALGKVLRLNLDGSTPPDNPWASSGGVRAQTWTTGHRNPYGLAFAPDGRLWMNEMGPMGGDELNLIVAGRNYGWPIVSNGDNYNGTPIPRHATRPEFEPPVIYWTPVIAPAGLAFYEGPMFPEWRGSAFIGGLRARALARIVFDGKGGAREADLWDMGQRIRDVAVAPDGALWVIEDGPEGRLLRLVPKRQAAG
ncbi:dehydrogenase [Bordetella genomosp. 8]|uniref:Dehydrogenase n=1 Tax=Bordetella genomosp. 8 TaxID=1416806 RepID=A0A1W6YP95_9BORD|nr:PQQ-dependent sugar dehydrogenase [Bordetella genomosp. 8]ARP82824.1 dehydrogenase [Bordetella genomosp. 8]